MSLEVMNFVLGCLVGFVGCILFEIFLLIYIAKKSQSEVIKRTVGKVKETLQ